MSEAEREIERWEERYADSRRRAMMFAADPIQNTVADLADLIDAKVALELARERARVDAEMESERNRMRAEIERINRTLSSLLIHSLPNN